jgi:glycine betaine catabolism B
VMLIEPQTTPSQLGKYIPYALLVGLFYSDTKLKISPEEALLIGNIFTFIFARKRRYVMKYTGKRQEAAGIFSYAFAMPPGLSFKAGQYMEWTIAQNKTDSRGNRRYLTISSSPTEKAVMFSVKHPPKASAFKQKLNQLKPGDSILASDLSGSFTLPKDASKKVALMAGGVGITPFRSMAKYLIDAGEKRDVVLLYSASDAAEFSFQDLFKQAAGVGMRTSYVTDKVDSSKIKSIVADFKQRTFYISGPYPYVHAMESNLLRLNVSPTDIITDYFPGYGD